jgi:hypothetical protein
MAKFSNSTSVTMPIGNELCEPEVSVSGWQGRFGASRVLMPIASMDEDGPFPSPVPKVWRTGQHADVQAIREAEFSQNLRDC